MRFPLKLSFALSVPLVVLMLLSTCVVGLSSTFVIVIDPAHGGADGGTQYENKTFEKDITLAVALFLQKEINRKKGLQALLTRSEDTTLPVKQRIEYANSQHANMLLSIHANSGFSGQSSGFECYVPTHQETSSKRDDLTDKMSNESIRFAHLILTEFDRILPRKGRGLREAPLTIFNGLSIPAVVAEIGFISYPADRNILLDQQFKKSIAEAVTSALITYNR